MHTSGEGMCENKTSRQKKNKKSSLIRKYNLIRLLQRITNFDLAIIEKTHVKE